MKMASHPIIPTGMWYDIKGRWQPATNVSRFNGLLFTPCFEGLFRLYKQKSSKKHSPTRFSRSNLSRCKVTLPAADLWRYVGTSYVEHKVQYSIRHSIKDYVTDKNRNEPESVFAIKKAICLTHSHYTRWVDAVGNNKIWYNTINFTCSEQLTGSQLSLPRRTKTKH